MFAIVDIAGFQNTVTPGMKLRVPKLFLKVGETATFDRVLLREGDKGVEVGTPYIAGAKVEAKVLSLGRGEKIRVFKMHPRKRYRKLQGHRQDYTEIEVTGIKG
ncbi:MAG TPA: 50S ribosomal protein L21 [Candidatus Peribacteraceae bacterium]|nr:50S ribosomal protein L21 [Candidatus Peribacteraceae bacterium]